MKTKLINQLQSLLDLVPALIQRCESCESGFVKSVKQWFTDAENLLAASHKPRLVALIQLQALVLAHQKGVLSKHCKLDDSPDNPTMALWNKLAATQDIRTRLNHVLTLVSYAEALNLMAVVLEKLPA